ncbi:MAG TPA: TonB family protein [Saprospiraceae bacterium]|nr:TonB family protein [Saprospiraceae bacterium]HMQ81738.1 TonB family protein [Saprospiraceae bacterium]
MNGKPTYHPLQSLRRWLSGDLTAREEEQLDQAAANDEFLADALKGYRAFPEGQHEVALDRLRAALQPAARKPRSLVFYVSRIAAVLVLAVAVSSAIFLWNLAESDQNNLAIQQTEAAPFADESNSADTFEEEAAQPPLATLEKESKNRSASRKREQEAPSAITQPEAPAQEQLAMNDEAIEEKAFSDDSLKPDPAPDLFTITRSKEAAKQEAELSPPQVEDAFISKSQPGQANAKPKGPVSVSGKVLDELGNPLIGANVRILGTTQGTVTDVEGLYNLNVWPEQSLQIDYVGFESRTLPVDQAFGKDIVLKESSVVLEEVAVTGLRSRKTESKINSVTKSDDVAAKKAADRAPEPIIGFRKFNKYVRQNLVYPPAAQSQQVEGTVILRFRIDAMGHPAQITVVQSLGFGCDEEAIRLLQEGPKWQGIGLETELEVLFKD